jgi:hypothetical protein
MPFSTLWLHPLADISTQSNNKKILPLVLKSRRVSDWTRRQIDRGLAKLLVDELKRVNQGDSSSWKNNESWRFGVPSPWMKDRKLTTSIVLDWPPKRTKGRLPIDCAYCFELYTFCRLQKYARRHWGQGDAMEVANVQTLFKQTQQLLQQSFATLRLYR